MLPVIHGEFRAGTDPELRFSPNGTAVCSFRAVASKRKKQDDGTWVDDKECWVKIICFKKMAENVAESIQKGHLVSVIGRVSTEKWQTSDGQDRVSFEVVADSIGPAITWDPARVMKAERPEGGQQQSSSRSAPADDPWAGPSESQPDDPPF